MSKELVSKKIQRKAARRAERKLPVQETTHDPEPTEVQSEAESADIGSIGIAMESDGISQR